MSDPKLSEAKKKILDWVLESCSACGMSGELGGCKECGKIRMCNCDGNWYEWGMGCN